MENKVNSVHYCGLLSKGFPETPPLSLRLYCLETMSVCLASAINERQILYFTYIHERCTEQCCNRFLFIRLRLHACCVIHFLFLYIFHVCLACLEVREGILSHTHLFESTGYGTHSPHIYLYVYFFLEVHMSGSHETCLAGFCFAFLFPTNYVWSLIYMLFSTNFIFYYRSRNTAWKCTTSAQQHQYCYMVWPIDWLQGPHKCSVFTSIALHMCSVVLFHIHSCFPMYIRTRACNTVLF